MNSDEEQDVFDDILTSSVPRGEEEVFDSDKDQSERSSTDDRDVFDDMSDASWSSATTAELPSSKVILDSLVRPILKTKDLDIINDLIDIYQNWFQEVKAKTLKSIDCADKLGLPSNKYRERINKVEKFYNATHAKIVTHCKTVMDDIGDEIDGQIGLKTPEEAARIAQGIDELYRESLSKSRKSKNGPSSSSVDNAAKENARSVFGLPVPPLPAGLTIMDDTTTSIDVSELKTLSDKLDERERSVRKKDVSAATEPIVAQLISAPIQKDMSRKIAKVPSQSDKEDKRRSNA